VGVDRSLNDVAQGGGLRQFYEDRQPARFGDHRARVALQMLSVAVAGRDRPRILDVGCGDGQLTGGAAAATGGGTLIGLDWSRAALEKARDKGLTLVQAEVDGGDLPFPEATFDVVMLNEVIEHLVEIDHAMVEARRVLVRGGHLIVSTPNLAAWFNRLLLLAGVQPVFSEVSREGVYGRPGSEVAGHLRLFTRRALGEFLPAHGFADVRIVGATYHDVPRLARPVDRALAHWPAMAAILVAGMRKEGVADEPHVGATFLSKGRPGTLASVMRRRRL
jgi:SAM-dependent methyltransferase